MRDARGEMLAKQARTMRHDRIHVCGESTSGAHIVLPALPNKPNSRRLKEEHH